MSRLSTDLFHDRETLRKTCTAIALGAVGAIILPDLSNFLAFIRLHVLHRSKLSRYQHKLRNATTTDTKTGNGKAWALVTGASDGIGYGFVQQLASKSFNVILHGRNESKIQNLIRKLQEEFPNTEFESFICDATDREAWVPAFDVLLDMLKTKNISLTILVNNVGGTRTFDCLGDFKYDQLNALIDMNAVFPAQITRAVLPTLISNQPSLMINMSSIGGVLPLPYLNAYNASKAFNRHLSKAVRMELGAEGHSEVEVLSIIAGSVQSSGMTVNTSIGVPSSKAFAGSVLGLVGCGRDEMASWWMHAIQLWFVGTVLPVWLREKFMVKAIKDTKEALSHGGKEDAKE